MTQTLVKIQIISHKLNRFKFGKIFSRILEVFIRLTYSAAIPSEAKIDHTVHFGHNGLAVVINQNCTIERGVFIGSHVVLGGKTPIKGAPYIESDAIIHTGAKIIGPIKIGKGSVIAANAVVTKDIPERSLAGGIPARILKNNINSKEYFPIADMSNLEMNDLQFYRSNNIYSQNGEDGVIKELFARLNVKNGWFCEFGAWDGKYGSNCYALLKNSGWNGVMIEGDPVRFKALQKTASKHNNKLYIHNKYVLHESTVDTLDQILSETPIPKNFELLSIDIDSYDYNVWKSLNNYRPICVIIEIDSSTPPGEEYVFDKSGRLTSFTSMIKLGYEKGYTPICHTGNLFFIANEYIDLLNISEKFIKEPNLLFDDSWIKPSKFKNFCRKIKYMTMQRLLTKLEQYF